MGAAEKADNHLDHGAEALPSILLVDDHQVTADIERAYFAGVGFRVLLATTPADAESIVRQEHVDLIMIDVEFARKQGLKVMQAARRVSKNDKIKALVTSLVGSPEVRKQALAAGADGFFTKPAPRPKVLKEIKKMTEQKTRGSERIKQSLQIRCVVEGGEETVQARSLDISSEGMHLQLADAQRSKPRMGAKVTLQFSLGGKEKPLSIAGDVVRHTQEGFGVKFGALNTIQSRQLDKYLLKFSMEHRASQYYL